MENKKTESFKITINNIDEVNRKKTDWWIWLVSFIGILFGAALTICSLIMFIYYFDITPQPTGYITGISGGLTITIGVIAQLLVLVHRKSDAKMKKFEKYEHDFTNFFVKNSLWNEVVLYALKYAENSSGISYSLKLVEHTKKQIVIEITIKHDYDSLKTLIDTYTIYLGNFLLTNSIFRNMIVDKYKISFKKSFDYNDYILAVSAFDSEFKKTLIAMEKIFLSYYYDHYDNDAFDRNMKGRLREWGSTMVPYIALIIQSEEFNEGLNSIDIAPYFFYDLSKKGEKDNE